MVQHSARIASSVILVTGATGHVGSTLIAQLAAHGQPVRAMTRRPDAVEVPPGVQAVYGDCDDPTRLDAEGTELLPTVAQVLGRPPTTFAQWATAHAGLFTRTELH